MGNENFALVIALAASSMVGCVASDAPEVEVEGQQALAALPGGGAGMKLAAPDLARLNELTAPAAVLGPAPGVSYFQTYAVGSTLAGVWENISASQTSTTLDHGGASLSVAVIQLGYGNGGATLNVTGVHYAQDRLCGSSSSLHICGNGEIIIGYIDYYSFNGQQSGTFMAYTDSVASPFGHWTDSLFVR